jgi:ActR/RegA family two-component response regulator
MSVTDVLVVDDDVGVCRIVQRMLSNEQCKVQISQSVTDALGAIEQKAFDAYVIDFKLPDGSGLDVAEGVRSKWGASPIILISGYDPAAVALRAEKLCISNFLEKPFSREIICEAVSKAIGSLKPAPKLSPVDPPTSPPPVRRRTLLGSILEASGIMTPGERLHQNHGVLSFSPEAIIAETSPPDQSPCSVPKRHARNPSLVTSTVLIRQVSDIAGRRERDRRKRFSVP